jgi:hypothetical protein
MTSKQCDECAVVVAGVIANTFFKTDYFIWKGRFIDEFIEAFKANDPAFDHARFKEACLEPSAVFDSREV